MKIMFKAFAVILLLVSFALTVVGCDSQPLSTSVATETEQNVFIYMSDIVIETSQEPKLEKLFGCVIYGLDIKVNVEGEIKPLSQLDRQYGKLVIETIFNSLERDLFGEKCKKELYNDGGSVEYIYDNYKVIQSNKIENINKGFRTRYDVTQYISCNNVDFSELNEMAIENNLIDYNYKDLVLIGGNYDFIVEQSKEFKIEKLYGFVLYCVDIKLKVGDEYKDIHELDEESVKELYSWILKKTEWDTKSGVCENDGYYDGGTEFYEYQDYRLTLGHGLTHQYTDDGKRIYDVTKYIGPAGVGLSELEDAATKKGYNDYAPDSNEELITQNIIICDSKNPEMFKMHGYVIYGLDIYINMNSELVNIFEMDDKLARNVLKDLFSRVEDDEKNGVCERTGYDDGGSVQYIYDDYMIILSDTLDGDVTKYISCKSIGLSNLRKTAKDHGYLDYNRRR